ncbi:MAG: serine dehydratase subunit alpha family protein [Bacilli bacterium]|nr:serine dehydratase subunit alpha family protein [Bacilli bacterium]MBN2877243.1 serine dehydratase subunit alpha family protein [Bacilli bacterium]
MTKIEYEQEFFQILEEELVPAAGCTEPISLAFAGAKARELLGDIPEKITIECSGNLIKNIRCVTVPNTNNLVGIDASILTGVVGGDPTRGLEVLSGLKQEELIQVNQLLTKKMITTKLLDTPLNLHYVMSCETKDHSCEIEVKNLHTNITKILLDGKVIHHKETNNNEYFGVETDRSFLTVERILNFSNLVSIDKIRPLLEPQIEYNMDIAEEGFKRHFSVSIGPTILKHDSSIYGQMKAYAASASEARMSGCSLPVITNSGSGNQGITSSVPVILYAKHKYLKEEKMLRALVLSNLLTIYQKGFIGRLSAFCGAISAAISSGAALTYIEGGTLDQIKMTIINALANVSGVVCDGAKPSCAAKIVTGLEAAFLGHFLAMDDHSYNPFSGIIQKDVDETISAIGKMANQGMKETDHVILNIMMEK